MKYLGEAMTIAIVLSYDRNQHLGMCGEAPPPQDDAPVRLVVPWKSRSLRDMGNGCLSQSTLPKLFFIGEPGRILVAGRGREFARSWPNQQVVTVKGVHYFQEDSPVELGTALATFVESVRA